MNRFEGKVAFITGAGSGIGRAIAVRLASEGATVVGADINAGRLEEVGAEIGAAFDPVVLDVSKRADCFAAVDAAAQRHGRLDVLGNVAGVTTSNNFTDVTEENYRWLMSICADGPFFLCQAAIPHLLKTSGNIVNVASNSGIRGVPYIAPYAMTKGAIIALTRALAMEYMKSPIRINAIAPGATLTNIGENFERPADYDQQLVGISTHMMKGIGMPDDLAAFFAFVAADEAIGVHGAILTCDRGLTV